jgi:hypothetical protein
VSKQVLDIEQMKHLQELGLDTSKASMCYVVDDSKAYKPILCVSGNESEYLDAISYSVPAFTLQDIIDFFPVNIDGYVLSIGKKGVAYNRYEDLETKVGKGDRELIDAAYKMLCWCIENKHIDKRHLSHETKV